MVSPHTLFHHTPRPNGYLPAARAGRAARAAGGGGAFSGHHDAGSDLPQMEEEMDLSDSGDLTAKISIGLNGNVAKFLKFCPSSTVYTRAALTKICDALLIIYLCS